MIKKFTSDITNKWDNEYEHLETTYEDKIVKNRTDFVMNMLYELVYETILDRANILNTFKTLECGCGGGRVSTYLAKHGAETVCVDMSLEALRLASNNFYKEKMPSSFYQADVCHLPFSNNYFDVVMSYGLMEHFVDIHTPFLEMTRVLKKGGVSVHTIIPKKFSLWSVAHVWNFMMRILVHLRDGKIKNIIKNSRRNFPFFENNYSKKQYLNAMKQSGLINCSITGITLWAPFTLPRKMENRVLKLAERNKGKLQQFDRSESKITDILAPILFAVGQKS